MPATKLRYEAVYNIKCSAVAQIGDLLVAIDIAGKRGGAAVPFLWGGSWVPI